MSLAQHDKKNGILASYDIKNYKIDNLAHGSHIIYFILVKQKVPITYA